MSLTDITNKILSDAKEKAEEITQESQKELDRVLAEKNQKIVQVIQDIKVHGKEKAIKIQEQTDFRERMVEKNADLSLKQELINQVFEDAKEKLMNLDDEQFVELMVKMLNASDKVENAEVITSKEKEDLIKKALKKGGLSYKISEKKLKKGQEGFILSSDIIEIDNTIDNYINNSKKEFSVEVAKRLFS